MSIDGYGFGREWQLFDYSTLLEDKLAEEIGMKPRRGGMMVNGPPDEDLEKYLPTSFDTQGTADSIKAIDAMMGAGTAPTGINPAAPAESQPPAVAGPASEPDKYERMRGVSNSDRLGAIGMAMSAIGTPQFSSVYRGAQLGLVDKQKTADEYNIMLEEGTKSALEWKDGVAYRMPSRFIKNGDGTYSVNPKQGSPQRVEGTGKISELARLAGIPPEEAAVLSEMTGDNADTAMGYVYARAFEGFEGNLRDYIASPINANKPAGSVSFDRNYEIARSIDGMSNDDAMKVAQLFDTGGIKTQTLDTGEIIGIDAQGNTKIIRDLETAMEFGERAQRALQESEDEVGQYDSIVTSARGKLDANAEEYRNQTRGIRVLDRWEEKIRGMTEEQFDEIFGWGNQLMYDFFGKGHPTLATLNAVTTYEGLQTLANEANLAPVSNLEFTKVGGLLGSGKLESKEQLLGLFEEARFRTNDKIDKIMRDDEYYLHRLQEVPNDRWYKMYSRRPYMTAEETLREAQNGGR